MKNVSTNNHWIDIPGAAGTTEWNTNRLLETTQYRVKFKNGVCPEAFSNIITVAVHIPITGKVKFTENSLCSFILTGSIWTVLFGFTTSSFSFNKDLNIYFLNS